jgi:cytochrome P450 family 12
LFRTFLFLFLGRFDGLLMTEIQQELCNDFGNIVKFRGIFGKEDIIFAMTPEDCETVFRTEGVWPIRRGNDTFVYFRNKVRPDLFKGVGGLLSE